MSYVFGIVSAALVLGVVIELLRRGKLKERFAFWWILAGSLGLIAGIFPETLGWVSTQLGIEVPLNLVLFSAVIVLFLVNLQHSSELAKMEERTRSLAEELALLKNGEA